MGGTRSRTQEHAAQPPSHPRRAASETGSAHPRCPHHRGAASRRSHLVLSLCRAFLWNRRQRTISRCGSFPFRPEPPAVGTVLRPEAFHPGQRAPALARTPGEGGAAVLSPAALAAGFPGPLWAGASTPGWREPGPLPLPQHSQGTVALASVFGKAEVSSASFPGVWTPASQERRASEMPWRQRKPKRPGRPSLVLAVAWAPGTGPAAGSVRKRPQAGYGIWQCSRQSQEGDSACSVCGAQVFHHGDQDSQDSHHGTAASRPPVSRPTPRSSLQTVAYSSLCRHGCRGQRQLRGGQGTSRRSPAIKAGAGTGARQSAPLCPGLKSPSLQGPVTFGPNVGSIQSPGSTRGFRCWPQPPAIPPGPRPGTGFVKHPGDKGRGHPSPPS